MYKVIERRMIVPNLHEFTVRAPAVAESVKPSNSVVLMAQRPRRVLIA
jgi:hypothetical protein